MTAEPLLTDGRKGETEAVREEGREDMRSVVEEDDE